MIVEQKKTLRIVFDMDGTLIGYGIGDGPYQSDINTKMIKKALSMKEEGHEIIIWTGATRSWYEMLAYHFPSLRLFDEVYTRDELNPFYEDEYGDVHAFKNLRLIEGDILFDNDPNHEQVATRLGLEKKYVTVNTFGVMPEGNPSKLGGD